MKHRSSRRKNRGDAPTYLSRVMSAAKAGEVVHVVIAHAADCARPRGGDCTCIPDVSAQHADGLRSDVDLDGRASDGRLPS